MFKRADIRIVLLLFVLGGGSSAWAQAEDAPVPNVDQAKVEQLTDLVVQTLPLDKLVRHEKDADPDWPLKGETDRISAEQLQCMRDQYLPKDYREMKRQDVIAFVNRYPGEADDALRTLNGGVAETFAKFFFNGTVDEKAEIDAKMSLIHNNPTLLLAVLAVESDYKDKYQHLRELIGFSGNPMLAGAGIHQDIQLVMSKLRLRAMSECKIPTSTLAQAGDVPQTSVAQAKVEQLTDLVMQAVPIGELFQQMQDKNPDWPFQGKRDKVTSEQLQCMRERISQVGYRAMKRQSVADFVERYPDEVDDAMKVLQDGATEALAAPIRGDISEAISGQKTDYGEIQNRLTPAQLSLTTGLVMEEKYQHLRTLLGFVEGEEFRRLRALLALKEGESGTESFGSRAAGFVIGIWFSYAKLLRNSMNECNISMSALG